MIVVVVILAVVALAALAGALATRARLSTQQKLTAAAEERATKQAGELATAAAALEEATRERAAAEEQAAVARGEAELAAAEGQAAEERAAAAERRVAEFAATSGVDPDVLWTLEQARSERTWRHSVAPGPDAVSVFTDASDPLLEALQVELDAAREEVGAIVELEVELPPGVTAAGSVLALRAAQELLAGVVRRAEVTTLRVLADGHDLIVAVRPVDEDGEPVSTDPLTLPASVHIEPIEDGVRIRDAIRSPT